MRRIARMVAYWVGDTLHALQLDGAAVLWFNARWSPGQWLLLWGHSRPIAGFTRIKWDARTNTITEVSHD